MISFYIKYSFSKGQFTAIIALDINIPSATFIISSKLAIDFYINLIIIYYFFMIDI